MAIAVSISNARRDHQVVTAAIGAVTTWQEITLPSWARYIKVINYGADDMYMSTDVDDGDAGSGGVAIPAGGSYRFKAGIAAFIAVRHASGSYTFGLALTSQGGR